MSQATRPATSKKKWPWVVGAAGGVILIAGAVNSGKPSAQNDAQTAPAAITQTVPTTIVSTSVVTSALTQTLTAEPVTVTVTAPAEAADGAGAVIAEAEVPAAPAPAPLAAVPSTTAAAETMPPTPDAPADNVSFENCTEAWAAGAAPILRGDPGYAKDLDRNNDGIGCEDPPS